MSLALLLVFVFTIPWQTTIESLSRRVGYIAFVSGVLTCLAERRIAKPPAFVLAACAFVAWQLTTYFWSTNPESTLGVVYDMLPMLVVVWLVTQLGNGKWESYALMQAFVVGCIVLSAVVVLAYLSGGGGGTYRYAPAAYGLNESADMLAMGIALAMIAISTRRRGMLFWVDVGFLPIGLLGVVLTGSRSGFLFAGVAMLGVLLLYGRPAFCNVVSGPSCSLGYS